MNKKILFTVCATATLASAAANIDDFEDGKDLDDLLDEEAAADAADEEAKASEEKKNDSK